MKDITVLVYQKNGQCQDIQIPVNITCKQLIDGLYSGLEAGSPIPTGIRSENPKAYITGIAKVSEMGLHHGTELFL